MHHIHISTGFMSLTALFVVAFVAVIFAFVRSMRNDRLEAEAAIERAKLDAAYRAANPVRVTAEQTQQVHGERLAARQAVNGTPFAPYEPRPAITMTTPVSPAYYAAAPVYHSDPLTGLATGMLIGSALGHHDHTTIIERGTDTTPTHTHTFTDSSPSSSSSSSDSGFSYSDSSSSSSSYDSGSSGGFDASW